MKIKENKTFIILSIFIVLLLILSPIKSFRCNFVFDEVVWNVALNDSLNLPNIYLKEEHINVLYNREAMLWGISWRFMGSSYDTIHRILGNSGCPEAFYPPRKYQNPLTLCYPIGQSASGPPNCLVLYFNEKYALFDYEVLIAQ